MQPRRVGFAIALSLLGVLACNEVPLKGSEPLGPSPSKARLDDGDELTPFQQSIKKTIAQRSQSGLPVPKISFDYDSDNGTNLSALQRRAGTAGESFTITATTTLEFDHPRQAGLDQWPPFIIEGEVPPEQGRIQKGDYTEVVKDYIARKLPGIWETHEFGYEPRTRTITETFTVTYPAETQLQGEGDLVHGLTFTGPDIDWTVSDDACVCIPELGCACAWKFEAGFRLDWGFGLRLPMNVSVTSDDPVNEGNTFTPTSLTQGVDWSPADYTAAGIAPEDGNEFVMRVEFFLGILVEVAEITVVDLGPNINEDRSSSFTTPFGPGAVFDLPTIDVPIYGVDLALVAAEFGAAITPQAGSDRFRANWMASNELSGSGSLTYTDPAVAENLSSVIAIDGPAVGNLQIKNSKYVLDQFMIELGAYFEIDIFGLFDDRWEIPITDFDLSDLIPDISVPIHAGANPTTLNSSVAVQNVAPTAEINVAGANLINGIHTFFADVGEEIVFPGNSHDPGRDDLTLEWDFGDGSPSPDTSTNHPLAAATGPNDVTEDQAYTFAGACLYEVALQSTDSDGASAQDAVAVIIRSAMDNRARLAGYWTHQMKGNGQVEFTEDELECLLQIVGFMSTVFNEARDASTTDLAYDVMHLAQNSGEAEKLDRELLVAWMNFANAAVDLGGMVDIDGDTVPDMTFGAVLAAAEAVRLDPLATSAQLHEQKEIVHYVSTQETGNNSVTSSVTSLAH
jgi:hypothetical protein